MTEHMTDQLWKVSITLAPHGEKAESLYMPGCQIKLDYNAYNQTVHVSKAASEQVVSPRHIDWEECKDLPPDVIQELRTQEEKSKPQITKLGWLSQEQRREVEGSAMQLLNLQEQHEALMKQFYAQFIQPRQ